MQEQKLFIYSNFMRWPMYTPRKYKVKNITAIKGKDQNLICSCAGFYMLMDFDISSTIKTSRQTWYCFTKI